MKIENFVFDGDNRIARWEVDRNAYVIHAVRSACVNANSDFILAVVDNGSVKVLDGFSVAGKEFELPPPEHYAFEYVLSDNEKDVLVVCSGKNKNGDTLDWYFEINLKTACLKRYRRAY
ncbi:hypothetical protein H3H37_22245 [Duganella sp. LX20W]|uniref:Uncharacterized protein n=1 Tax=Rugamonas brunnea TaxID=2758569 RepID=A0A7W2EWB7_9BURK|nr:hypothetical protein [Rugamonas brunnea]MBA5639786.1 hypothetical protein [Rugamonas brunnea]